MKTYNTPALVAQGDVVELTQGILNSTTDPDGVSSMLAPGSAGFGL